MTAIVFSNLILRRAKKFRFFLLRKDILFLKSFFELNVGKLEGFISVQFPRSSNSSNVRETPMKDILILKKKSREHEERGARDRINVFQTKV